MAVICWEIRKARNNMCFENIIIKSHKEVICHICALIISCVGLSKKDLQDLLQGAKLLVRDANARLDNRIMDTDDDETGDMGLGHDEEN